MIWKDLRPVTKDMLERALDSKLHKQTFSYDAHSDRELSSLLTALDREVSKYSPERGETVEMRNMAEICASVLEAQTESAEVFIQLTRRALARNDFAKIDQLADVLFERFTAGEIAEIIRQTKMPQIKAIAFETLAVLPVTLIVPLLDDPLYFDIGFTVLEQQASEFESSEARTVLERLEIIDDHQWQ